MKNELAIILPSLGISGGSFEAVKLASRFSNLGFRVTIYTLWRNNSEVDSGGISTVSLSPFKQSKILAILSYLPILIRAWFLFNCVKNKPILMATHYSTLPVHSFSKRYRKFVFVQGSEWDFFSGKLRIFVRSIISYFYGKSTLIFANKFLQKKFMQSAQNTYVLPIWAESSFFCNLPMKNTQSRYYDIVFVLRKDKNKRPDLYRDFLQILKLNQDIKVACITPEEDLLEYFEPLVDRFLLSPSPAEMKMIYSNAKFFVHLSDSEGFGLPPLEAMGSGCIPFCRDSGGVKQFLSGCLKDLLLEHSLQADELVARFEETSVAYDRHQLYVDASRFSFLVGLFDCLRVRNEGFAGLVDKMSRKN